MTTEPADSAAGPSGLLRHRTDHYDDDKVTEGDCPSSCPSAERTEAGTGTPGALVLRRRWQQASLARAGEPADRGVIDAEASQQLTEEEKPIAAASTDRGKGTLLTAASKHSAVKSKAAKPLTVLQCIAENIESTPESGKEDASQQSVLCGHTGLASLAETPVPIGVKEDPHSPDENPRQEDTDKHVNTVEIALGDEGDHAGLAEADLTVQLEQRAMQELYRFQKQSMLRRSTEDNKSASVQTQPAFTTAANAAQEAQATQSAALGHLPVVPPVALLRQSAQRMAPSAHQCLYAPHRCPPEGYVK